MNRKTIELLQILASILFLGQWDTFKQQDTNVQLDNASQLLGVSYDDLLSYFTTHAISFSIQRNICTELHEIQQAHKREASATEIYCQVFQWIVSKINREMSKLSDNKCFISLLDIFGFEICTKTSWNC